MEPFIGQSVVVVSASTGEVTEAPAVVSAVAETEESGAVHVAVHAFWTPKADAACYSDILLYSDAETAQVDREDAKDANPTYAYVAG
jgi:hypothetical protein